jgi:hypothetical protein
MPITRRGFIQVPLATGAVAWTGALDADVINPPEAPAPKLYPAEVEALGAYVDTLLPGDEASPSASRLGVHIRLEAAARAKPRYLALVQWGVRWLHQRAIEEKRTGFSDLGERARVDVVRLAEAAPAESRPRLFFELTRQDAFIHYYSDPRSWPGAGYRGPPQPAGFLDFQQPPAGKG